MIIFLIKLNAFLKGLVLFIRPGVFLGFLREPALFTSNLLSLTKWIAEQPKNIGLNDFFSLKRDYSKRYTLYQHVVSLYNLKDDAITYLEFGVSDANSFKWWIQTNKNINSRFYGFDTFEGLPENWGLVFKKGDMSAQIPQIEDARAEFVKGLFQDSLPGFLLNHNLAGGNRKIIHMDADLFSSTLYSLANLAPYFNDGDIILFDEFNVPNHEFFAFKCFSESFYIKTKLIGAVNNYFQVAFLVTIPSSKK